MSGPMEPWRSRRLGRREQEREAQAQFLNIVLVTAGGRALRDLPEDLAPVEPRETRPRDRSLNGKARRRARKQRRSA